VQVIPRTNFATGNSPFNNRVPLKEVTIPKLVKQRKGHTKYDTEFEKLVAGKTAFETTEKGYEVINRALQRFLKFRELKGKMSIRRSLNRETRIVTVWLEKK
jgi:hypothetical protein